MTTGTVYLRDSRFRDNQVVVDYHTQYKHGRDYIDMRATALGKEKTTVRPHYPAYVAHLSLPLGRYNPSRNGQHSYESHVKEFVRSHGDELLRNIHRLYKDLGTQRDASRRRARVRRRRASRANYR